MTLPTEVKVVAWGVDRQGVLIDVSTDHADVIEAQSYAKQYPIVELIDKRHYDALLKQLT